MRKRLRFAVAAAAAVLLIVVTPGIASAAIGSGSRSQYRGPSSDSHGDQVWNASIDYLYLQSAAWATLSSGWCLDSLFDWERTSGHHDARGVRTCRSNAYIDNTWNAETSSGITGMQKAGTCYGPDQATNTTAVHCTNASGFLITVVGSINTAWPNNCVAHKTRNVDNSVISFGGGNPTFCTS